MGSTKGKKYHIALRESRRGRWRVGEKGMGAWRRGDKGGRGTSGGLKLVGVGVGSTQILNKCVCT